jgi:hypothetical protein
VVKVADVGFLGLLGSLSLAAAWSPTAALSVAQPLILQMGFSHILLEMIFNGIAIPAMCASVVDERDIHHSDGQERSQRQEILEKAAARSVAKNKTGLDFSSRDNNFVESKRMEMHHALFISWQVSGLISGHITSLRLRVSGWCLRGASSMKRRQC